MDKIKSNFEGQTIFVGMDIHKSSWNLGIYLNDMFVTNVHQKPNPAIMANYLKQHYPGAQYKAAYEAGKFGLTSCHNFINTMLYAAIPLCQYLVIVNLVVIFLLLKSKIKSPPSKNVDRLSMPKNVLPEA